MGGGPVAINTRECSSEDIVQVVKTPVSNTEAEIQKNQPTDQASFTESLLSSQSPAHALSEEDEEEPARLLFSKSKVYMHPSPYSKDNIPGFLSIVQVGLTSKYLLSWIPESALEGTEDYESYVLVEIYSNHENEPTIVNIPALSTLHAFSIPIKDLYSVLVHPPTITSWHGSVIFSKFGGETLPPLYFHDEESRSTIIDQDLRAEQLGAMGAQEAWSPGSALGGTSKLPPSWGGESILSQLRCYSHVVRSKLDTHLFLINPSKADMEVHETAIFDDDAVPPLPGNGLGGRRADNYHGNSILHQSLGGGGGGYPDDVSGGMDNFTFNVLNSFSRITRGARNAAQSAAQSVLSHPLAKPVLKNVPEPIAHFANAPGELTRLQETAGVDHYDAARVYLAKWARVVAEEGEKARRNEFLLAGPGGREVDEETGAFEVLATTYSITRPRATRAFNMPIVVTEWAAWFDDDGTLMLPEQEAKKRIFQRGLVDQVRKDVWPFLLQIFPWTSDTKSRVDILKSKTEDYLTLLSKWQDNEELKATERYAQEEHRIEIDCRRTDRTHPMFMATAVDTAEWTDSAHPPSSVHVLKMGEILTTYVFAEPGRDYVQGMSDLLSPIYVVCEGDVVLAYWCFCTLMERMKGNFLRDQSGMKRQLVELQRLIGVMDPQLYKHFDDTGALNLFFCFRWILCGFKRELSFDSTLQLWEVLWTDYLGTHMHLFFALAILEANRDIMIRYLSQFDEILKYVNELSGTLDVQALLSEMEMLYHTFLRVLEVSDQHKAEEADLERSLGKPKEDGLRNRKCPSTSEHGGPKDPNDLPDIDQTLKQLIL